MGKYLLHSPWYIWKTNFHSRELPLCLFNVSMSPFFCVLYWYFLLCRYIVHSRRACCVFIVFLSVWIADSCSAYKTVLLTSVSPSESFILLRDFPKTHLFVFYVCTQLYERKFLFEHIMCTTPHIGRSVATETDGKWQKWKYL